MIQVHHACGSHISHSGTVSAAQKDDRNGKAGDVPFLFLVSGLHDSVECAQVTAEARLFASNLLVSSGPWTERHAAIALRASVTEREDVPKSVEFRRRPGDH